MVQRIVSELQALAAEARRKHLEVRNAAETLLQRLQEGDQDAVLASLRKSDVGSHALLQPILLAFRSRSPKAVIIALNLLQRGVLLRLFPERSLTTIVDALHALLPSAGRADVDVQLKILQTVSALLTAYANITSTLLSSTLMLCFSLYEHSRVAVVSSTAAATLRQNIMTVFDKVHDEDRVFNEIKGGGEDAAAAAPLPVHTAQTPDGNVTLFPSSSDAYFLLSDLCALANGEEATFLPLSSLSKPFVLELLESVFTNHARLFAVGKDGARHPELLYVLRSAACPFLLKALSEPPAFPVFVRIMRLVLLLLRTFSEELVLEIEILLRMVLTMVHGERSSPSWHQVLALEVMRSLCADAQFMRRVWCWYDQKGTDTPLFAEVVSGLAQAAQEVQPALTLDAGLSAARLHVPEAAPEAVQEKGYSLYDAASAAVANVRNAAEGLLTTRPEPITASSAPPVQLLDQLDKTDVPQTGTPSLPATYVPLLLVWSHILLSQSLSVGTLQLYVNQFADTGRAPTTLPEEEETAMAKAMLTLGARPALSVLSFFLTVESPEYVYDQALLAFSQVTQAVGVVALDKERDYALTVMSDLGVPASALHGQSLRPRNAACQAALARTAKVLSGSLGERWRSVLLTLAQALALLPASATSKSEPSTAVPPPPLFPGPAAAEQPSSVSLHFLAPSALDSAQLKATLESVLDQAHWLTDTALVAFVSVLADLAKDQAGKGAQASDITATLLSQLERVMLANTTQTVAQLSRGPWEACTAPLFAIMEDAALPAAHRLHAASVLDAVCFAVLNAIDSDAQMQQRTVLSAVQRQSEFEQCSTPTDVAIRKEAVDFLLRILSSHAHRLQGGWDVVFNVCHAAADAVPALKAKQIPPGALLKAAFGCIRLICTDYLASLSDKELELCIDTLPSFCRQTEDINLALAANGALWDICADIHRRQTTPGAASMSSLWLFVLQRMRAIAGVPNADVRNGAISNLFQVLVQYSSALAVPDWHPVFRQILFPLHDAVFKDHAEEDGWEASQSLVLQGTSRVVQAMLPTLATEPSFSEIWEPFVDRIETTYTQASPAVAQTALDALLRVLRTPVSSASLRAAWQYTWRAWVRIGANQRADRSLPNLVAMAAMLDPLYTALGATLTVDDVRDLVRTLESCITLAISNNDATATKQLYALVGSARSALTRLPPHGIVPALRMTTLASYVRAALDATTQPSLPPPVARVRVQLAEDLLLYWQATYTADAQDEALYETALLDMLSILRQPLQSENAHAPSLTALARDTLYHIAKLGTPVVAGRSDKALPAAAYFQRLFACMEEVLQAEKLHEPRDRHKENQAQTFALLAVLESVVLPCAGSDAASYTVLPSFIEQLVGATQLYRRSGASMHANYGSLLPIDIHRDERMVYWTWDMLFALCRDDAGTAGHRLLGMLILPVLLKRCAEVLDTYISDVQVRGRMPLPRVRVEETNYVLYHLRWLTLAPGTLFLGQHRAEPGQAYAALEAYTEPSTPPSVRDAILQAPLAHLFGLRPQLDAIAALYGKSGNIPQQGTVGTSLAPLDPVLLSDVDAALAERARRAPPAWTTPPALAKQAQGLCSAWLGL